MKNEITDYLNNQKQINPDDNNKYYLLVHCATVTDSETQEEKDILGVLTNNAPIKLDYETLKQELTILYKTLLLITKIKEKENIIRIAFDSLYIFETLKDTTVSDIVVVGKEGEENMLECMAYNLPQNNVFGPNSPHTLVGVKMKEVKELEKLGVHCVSKMLDFIKSIVKKKEEENEN